MFVPQRYQLMRICTRSERNRQLGSRKETSSLPQGQCQKSSVDVPPQWFQRRSLKDKGPNPILTPELCPYRSQVSVFRLIFPWISTILAQGADALKMSDLLDF